MRYEPRAYQVFATEQILDKPAVGLFLEMGLGKTVSTLTAIQELMYDRFEVSKVLVVAPLRVADCTWPDELEKWDHLHLRYSKVLGSVEERRRALEAEADVYIINRENVVWLVEEYGRRWPFDMVVLDELSSFKNPRAKRFRALRKVRPQINRIVGLTGTPTPNGLIDLWSQIYLLDQGQRLGKTLTGYRDRYFVPDKRNRTVIWSWAPKPEAETVIHSRLSDICVSIQSRDWISLPERIDETIEITLPAGAWDQYRTLERELLLDYGDEDADVVAGSAAVLSNKLLQLASGAVYDEDGGVRHIHNAKVDVLEELVESANGQPVLIYYAYRHDADRIRERVEGARLLETSEDIRAWNSGQVSVMLAHPASAGHGLNLQDGGHHIIWFGVPWSLELYQQANARLHRSGQQHPVIVHHLCVKGTVDEDVLRALAAKDTTQQALIEALKARIRGAGRAA